MAKKPFFKKNLLYRGAIYKPVDTPLRLIYKGVTYSAVHRMVVGADKYDFPEVGLSLEQLREQLKPLEQQLTKALEEKREVREKSRFESLPEAPPQQEREPVPTDKAEIAESLRPLLEKLNTEVKRKLQQFRVSSSGDPTIEADEVDGIDIAVPVMTNNFSHFPNTRLSFDFSINLPKGTESIPDDILVDMKEDGFLKSLVSNIRNLGQARVDLTEVIFYFCKHGFAGTRNTIDEVLDTVGFLQNASEARPGKLLTIPEISEEGTEEDEEKLLEWAGAMFKEIIENDMHQDAGIQIARRSQWGTKAKMTEVLRGLESHNILGSDQVKILQGVIDSFSGDGTFGVFIREQLTPTVQTKKLGLRASVENAVKDLTKHEQYTGGVKYGVEDDGSIVAGIDAPYPFQYIFERAPGGAIKLREAGVQICDFTFIEKTPEDVKKLLTASLNLADAFKRSVNPTVSQNRKEREIAELFMKIQDYTQLIKEKEEEAAQKEEAPTEQEALKPQATE